MDNKPFGDPVKFMAGPSVVRYVTNVDEALHFLEWKWPYREGVAHRDAVRICQEVLAGERSVVAARRAFLAALAEEQFDLVA